MQAGPCHAGAGPATPCRGIVRRAGPHDMVPSEGRWWTGSPPTRSGPEGSSRNGFSPGSLAGLPPHPRPGGPSAQDPAARMSSTLFGPADTADKPLGEAPEEALPEPPAPEGPGLFG